MAATEPYAVDRVASASMLIERSTFQAIGGFDERTFPAVTTDSDFGIACWESGRIPVSTPHSVAVHATQAMVHRGRGLYSGPLYREFLIGRAVARLAEKWADVFGSGSYAERGTEDPSGDPAAHERALAVTAARAERPPQDPHRARAAI